MCLLCKKTHSILTATKQHHWTCWERCWHCSSWAHTTTKWQASNKPQWHIQYCQAVNSKQTANNIHHNGKQQSTMTHSILTSTKQQTRHTMTSASMYVCSMCMHVLHVCVLHVHAHMHVCMCMCMCLCVCFLFLQGKVIVHMYKCGKCVHTHLQFTANSAGQILALSKK